MSENKYQALREQLTYAPKNGHARISDQGKTEMEAYCKRYMAFLNAAKTEREAVRETVRQAEAAGFRPYTPGMEMTPGTKVYSVNQGHQPGGHRQEVPGRGHPDHCRPHRQSPPGSQAQSPV